ncbi:MAG TPA: insulinase family protein [Bacteroidales bacterium]|nr:insulinase family protein [Bacteroidales bacterium]
MKKIILLLMGMLILIPIFSQEFTYDPKASIPLDPDVIYGKLDNGLTYYIRENKKPEQRAEFYLVVDVGAIEEEDSQNGLAHFCEHMCFNGTQNFEKHEIINYLQSIGMKFGPEINAFTGQDNTTYMLQKVPTDDPANVDTALLILYDWANNVSFEAEEIDNERGVLHEEWRTRRGAMFRLMNKTQKVLLSGSKYADRDVIGDIEILDNFEYEELRRFYRDWYRPDLQAVIAVGDFDAKEMEKHITELFSGIPARENVKPRQTYPVPDHDGTLVSVLTDPEAQYNMIQIYWKHDPNTNRDMSYYRDGVVERLYGNMLNARLQELTVQDDPPFIVAVSMYQNVVRTKDAYVAFAIATNENIMPAVKALLVENERVKLHGFTATEFERAKASLLSEMETQYKERDKQESDAYVWQYYGNFLTDEPAPGAEFDYVFGKTVLDGITLDEINNLAKEWVTDENRMVAISGPESEEVVMPEKEQVLALLDEVAAMDIAAYVDKVSDAPLVSEVPRPGSIEKKKKDKKLGTETWELSNGVKVVFKTTDFQEDEIMMRAYSFGGSSLYDVKDLVSAENATSIIGMSGLAGFDDTQLQKKLAGKIVNVYPYIGETTEGFGGSCIPENFETMLQLVYLYYTQPRKDQTTYNSFMNRMKGILANRAKDPASALQDTIQVTMANYSDRARPMTAELLDEVDLNKVFYIFNERFGDPGGFTFYFVGNIVPEAVENEVLTYLGGLPKVTRNETFRDNGVRPPAGTVKKVVLRDMEVPKGTVNINFVGVYDYDDPMARMELSALCDILDIRYTETIREEQGGTYGVSVWDSQVHYPWENYTVTIYFDCDPENVEKLTAIVFDEINKLKKEGPAEKDLKGVKENLLKSRAENLKKNNFWISALINIDMNDENPKDLFSYEDRVGSLSIESLKKAANKFFTEEFVEVVLKPSDNSRNVKNPMLEE